MLATLRRRRPEWVPYVVWTGSVAVPADFVGMHFSRWPRGAPLSPAPTYGHGLVRSHDYGPATDAERITWWHCHPSNGVFTWDGLDHWVNTHYNAGRALWYCIFNTPTWAAQAAYAGTANVYGYLGGCSPPDNLSYLSAFVTALVTRYNSGGVRKIKYLEAWNEPTFPNAAPAGFFWGSAAEMAAMCRTIKTAAKAVDSGITVVSPGFTGFGHAVQVLNASDGAAGSGRDHFDVFAHHPYTIYGLTDPLRSASVEVQAFTAAVRAEMVAGGLAANFPLHGSEVGYDSNPAAAAITGTAPAQFASWLKKAGVMMAAAGWKSVCWYSHDGELIGKPSVNVDVARAVAWLHDAIAGKTITEVRKEAVGWSVLANGQRYNFA